MKKTIFLILFFIHQLLLAQPIAMVAKAKVTVCCINKNTGEPVTASSNSSCESTCKSLGQAATYPHLKSVECGRHKKTGSAVMASIYDGQKKEIYCANACKNVCQK